MYTDEAHHLHQDTPNDYDSKHVCRDMGQLVVASESELESHTESLPARQLQPLFEILQ